VAFGDGDRDVFVSTSDFGAVVVVGGTTAAGVLRLQWLEEQDASGSVVRTQRPTLRVKRGAFTLPALDAAVTVAGVAYKYRGKVNASVQANASTSGFEDWLLVGGTAN
jgi:hypothetical protein